MTKSHCSFGILFVVVLNAMLVPGKAAGDTAASVETVACRTGDFVRYKASIDADHIDQPTYLLLSVESTAVAGLRRAVCYDYSLDGLSDAQKLLLASRIGVANRCVQREAAAINAEQFPRVIAYLRQEKGVLSTIEQVLRFGEIREAAAKSATEGAKHTFELSTPMLGLPKKAAESMEAIYGGGEAARHFLSKVGKDIRKDVAKDAFLKALNPFEMIGDRIRKQADENFSDRLAQIASMSECQ